MVDFAEKNVIDIGTGAPISTNGSKVTKTIFGGGGGASVDNETKNYLDANMRAVKAENDTRFNDVATKLDTMVGMIGQIPKPVGFWQLAGMAATAVVALVTIFGVMADRFDGGVAARGTFDAIVQQQRQVDIEQNQRLDQIISILETRFGESEESTSD